MFRPVASLWPATGAAVLAFAVGSWAVGQRLIAIVVTGAVLLLAFAGGDTAQAFFVFAETPAANWDAALAGCLLWVGLQRWMWTLDEDQAGYESCRYVAAQSRLVVRLPRRPCWAQPGLPEGAGLRRSRLLSGFAFGLQDRLLEAGVQRWRGKIGWQVLRWELAWPDLDDRNLDRAAWAVEPGCSGGPAGGMAAEWWGGKPSFQSSPPA